MSQTKVQLIAPIGVVTATTLETTGVLTATTFVGDIAGTVTGITSTTDNLNLGIITATSFAGDFSGIGSGLTGTPNVVAGVVTATKFVGNTPGTVSGIADGTNINAGIITATSFVGNITGNAAGLSTTTGHANLGIVTATSFHGSGANLEGVSSGPVSQQAVTADGATTTIDLSDGNVIYMTQSANTTVAFASTEGNTDVVYLIRTKDDTTTERTITWPSGMVWDGGTAPTLLSANFVNDAQIFKLTTRDNGATWYGVEVYNLDSGDYGLMSWGAGATGKTAQNNQTNYSSPKQVGSSNDWSSVSKGKATSAGSIKEDGTLYMWGNNENGTLGQNNIVDYSSPVQIPGTTWNQIAVGGDEVGGAVKTDGTLWAWGNNANGQLGQNSEVKYSSPVQVPGTTWKQLSLGDTGAAATKTDGTLWMWGTNSNGQLAQSNQTEYSSPVQVPGTTWAYVQGGGTNHWIATKTDGTLWTWGLGNHGVLALNSTSSFSSPKQVPGTTWDYTNASAISAGDNCCHAVKTDGTLWAWGTGYLGRLGNNQTDGRSSPIQVPGTTWTTVSYSYAPCLATRSDNTLWAWGQNTSGVLGQGNNTQYSSPVQIPGKWKTSAYGIGGHSMFGLALNKK